MTQVPRLPLLAPWYRVVGDGERLLLEYGQSLVVLEGAAVRALLPALLPLLDGTRTVDGLVERLGAPVRPAIEAALELLAGRGVVVEGPDAPAAGRASAHAVAAAYGLPPAVAAARLREASVGIVGAGPLGFDLARLLHDAGVGRIRRVGWNGRESQTDARAQPARPFNGADERRLGVDLAVVVPAPDEHDRLPAWNLAALRSGARWLLLRPYDGRFASVGPIVVPGQTCCYECLLLRRAANSGYSAELAEVEAAPFAAPRDAGVDAFAAALAAHLAVRYVAGSDTTLPGVLHTLETRPALRLEEHAVLRVPRCGACSAAARAAPPLPWHQAVAA